MVWRNDMERAFEEAKASGCPMLLDFSAAPT